MLLQSLLVSVRFLKTLNSMFLSVDFLPKLSCLLHASIFVYVTFSNPVWFYEHVTLHACDKEEETVTNQKKKKLFIVTGKGVHKKIKTYYLKKYFTYKCFS